MDKSELEKTIEQKRQEAIKNSLNTSKKLDSKQINQALFHPKKNLLKNSILFIFFLIIILIFIFSFMPNTPHNDPDYDNIQTIKKTLKNAVIGRDGYYGSADEAREKFPQVVLHRRDEIGNVWSITMINFNPISFNLYPLKVDVATHAATQVPSHKDNNVIVQYGTGFYNFTPDTYIIDGSVYVVDVDEVKHTIILEQLYQLNPKKYGIDKKFN